MALFRSACMAAVLALAPALAAQDPGESPERYAQVKVLEGPATLHKGESDLALALNVPVAEGDRLEAQGRGVLQLGDGSRIAFDAGTSFQVAELFADTQGVREVLLRLQYGRLRIRMGAQSGARLRVDTPAGSGTLENRTDATFQAASDHSLEHWVSAGRTGFANRSGSTVVRAGERLAVNSSQDGLDRLTPFNTFDQDDFDAWCSPLLNVPPSASAARVPPEIRYYADSLDGYGSWVYVPDCGTWCWCPAGLAPDWRPYWDGRWACCPGGLTWISDEPWGFVTYHFGRWGWNAGLGWYWIPGIYYSPAWVAWESSGFYFGWAPLGFYNRPVAWGHGPWQGGYAWNIVNISYLTAANVRPRTFISGSLASSFSRPGAAYQGRMLVTPAEFQSPAQIQRLAQQPSLLQQRTAAYTQGHPLAPAQAGGRFEATVPAPRHPLLRAPETAAPRGAVPETVPRNEAGERFRPEERVQEYHPAAPAQAAPKASRPATGAPHPHHQPQAEESPREEARPGTPGKGGDLKPR